VDVSELEVEEWEAVLGHWAKLEASSDPLALERALGPVVMRLLLRKGIGRVTPATWEMLLVAFWQSMRDAFESRKRNADGDYSPDLKAERFPEWNPTSASRGPAMSLKGLVAAWWVEAQATGRKPSTHESYRNTMAAFVEYLGHDDATRINRNDVIRFKDHRLASTNPRTGQPISAKTVKDSDLSGLKTIFGWAVVNEKMLSNPAEGVTIKLGRPRRLRSKGFTKDEAAAILATAYALKQGGERSRTFAAKRWVPWLCAYTGARVGEIAQLRKQDIRCEAKHWVITITPEAGTVKTNEARDVVLHPHLVKLGFADFVKSAEPGHLFLQPSSNGDVRGPLRGLKNRLAEFARSVVLDRNVAPNHGWRHRFKTVGMEAGVAPRILDAIQGQSARTVADTYGDVTIRTQAAALSKFPRYSIGE
jgi:integrase